VTSFAEGLIGITLDDRYRLDAVLGEGGMGAVFRATHLAMDRKVAVKLLKPHLANNEASIERFKREARSTMKVESPHAVKVLDYGITPQHDYYMVLEYLDGRTVQRELDIDGMFTPARVVHIGRQALHALGAAHAIGLVHRDIKPENILLMRHGADADYTKLLDFGVAKLMEGAAKSTQSQLNLTQVGTVFGTPEFMSPEQACGHLLDGRSDLYSLASTLFAMLTGCGLFEANSAIEWLTHHVRTPPPRLAMLRPELATYPELDEVLQACLAKHRDQRPRSAAELDALLARIEPTLQRPMGASPGTSKVKVFSSSMFFDALPPGTVEPGETLLPNAGVSLQDIEAVSVETAALHPVAPKRRGLLLGVIALVVLGVLSVAIGMVVTKKSKPTPPDAAVAVAPPPDAPPPRDTAIADAALPDAIATADAAPRPDAAVATGSNGSSGSNGSRPPVSSEALKFLAAAETAAAAGDAFTELASAQAALEAPGGLPPPKKLRARYLYCDGLLGTAGNRDRGCKCLRDLRNNLAISRAKAAGCPD
jgi:serine/threonine protein kinase